MEEGDYKVYILFSAQLDKYYTGMTSQTITDTGIFIYKLHWDSNKYKVKKKYQLNQNLLEPSNYWSLLFPNTKEMSNPN